MGWHVLNFSESITFSIIGPPSVQSISKETELFVHYFLIVWLVIVSFLFCYSGGWSLDLGMSRLRLCVYVFHIFLGGPRCSTRRVMRSSFPFGLSCHWLSVRSDQTGLTEWNPTNFFFKRLKWTFSHHINKHTQKAFSKFRCSETEHRNLCLKRAKS